MLNRIKRLIRHRWFEESTVRRLIPADQLERLRRRITASEQRHSGEIRIYLEGGLPNSYLLRRDSTPALIRQRAVMLFGKQRIWDTEHNNGVLIYVLLAERAIEIVADRGLNKTVTHTQWHAMIERMQTHFKDGKFEEGLTQALEEVSYVLVQNFPLEAGEPRRNELADEPEVS